MIDEFKLATNSQLAREVLDRAWAAVEAEEFYKALKLVQRIINQEVWILGNASSSSLF